MTFDIQPLTFEICFRSSLLEGQSKGQKAKVALPLPKIVYTPVGQISPSTFSFSRQPRNVAAYNRRATRHDNLSTAGVKEVIVERVDNFLEITMEWVAIGADVNGWDVFMQNALQGAQFSYYPDATQAAYTNYTLEDTDWLPAYKAPGQYTFKMLFRQVVT
jgi:hypothetical protein